VVRRYGYTVFMDEVARLLNDMVEGGIITDYAVFGAVAQMRYTEAVVTLDADILVAVPDPDALDVYYARSMLSARSVATDPRVKPFALGIGLCNSYPLSAR